MRIIETWTLRFNGSNLLQIMFSPNCLAASIHIIWDKIQRYTFVRLVDSKDFTASIFDNNIFFVILLNRFLRITKNSWNLRKLLFLRLSTIQILWIYFVLSESDFLSFQKYYVSIQLPIILNYWVPTLNTTLSKTLNISWITQCSFSILLNTFFTYLYIRRTRTINTIIPIGMRPAIRIDFTGIGSKRKVNQFHPSLFLTPALLLINFNTSWSSTHSSDT